ncbi:MAG: hypothetical protein QOJ77_1352, partial [Microbacteriaceae bacterium]|nr:hypothetical protein [Microbacteriaceae bacterium]
MTQTMHYLAEARGALARAAHGLRMGADTQGARDLCGPSG